MLTHVVLGPRLITPNDAPDASIAGLPESPAHRDRLAPASSAGFVAAHTAGAPRAVNREVTVSTES